jgi:transposase-like protein
MTQVTQPVVFLAVEDYPRDLLELEARFSNEEACREYLFALRWPEGFLCPRCNGAEFWPLYGPLLECAGCHRQTSVTAGTIFQDSRLPLTLWLRAVWWVTSQKNGVSAMGLQRVLGLKSYKTAWTLLHKLRHAMVCPGRDRLSGRVEADETYLDGKEEGTHGRQTESKALIAVAAEENGAGIGRIRMRRIPDASSDSLMPFVEDCVEPGSVVHTDGWLSYLPLESKGYRHEITFLKRNSKTASELIPRVYLVVALLKRWKNDPSLLAFLRSL